MAKPLAEKLYDQPNDKTHYQGHKTNVALCGQAQWGGKDQPLPTDAPVDCAVCLAIGRYVQSRTFD